MASVCWSSSFPSFPRSGLFAGEVVKVRRVLSSISVSLAGRGGEGGRGRLWAIRFWWWVWWSSSPFLLRPAVVARGAAVEKLRVAAGGGRGAALASCAFCWSWRFRGVDGDPDQGARSGRVVSEWGELGVSRRPMQDPPEVCTSNSPELVSRAAHNACGQGAPPASSQEEEDDVVLGCLLLYLFSELCAVLEPGKPPKDDKVAILSDAARLLDQLRAEAQKLKTSNESLQDSIKSLKSEKLKTERERLEQMLKGDRAAAPPQFIPYPAAAAAPQFHPFAHAGKFVPAYPPLAAFWQWIPPTSLDTSKDPTHWPPVA